MTPTDRIPFTTLFIKYGLGLMVFIILAGASTSSFGQTIYGTPTGKRYHLASCRMVENVSHKITDPSTTHLTPCKICKPPAVSQLRQDLSSKDKSVGIKKSVRCKGTTKRGTHCKHQTRLANGYCYQHTAQDPTNRKTSITDSPKSHVSTYRCGARTKSGKACRRKVKGGGYCYQHR